MTVIKEIYGYREMIFSLIRRDLRGRYKGSVLGFLWTFLNPLLQLLVYTLVFSTIMRNGIENYYLFLFVALIPWIFFSSSLTGGASCILASKEMVKKIYFPREVLPIAHVSCQFVNMLFSFVIVFLAIFIGGKRPPVPALLCLIPLMLVEYFLALGISMITSALTVYMRDLEHVLGIVAMAWQFLTPVMYPVEWVPESFFTIFMLNPMTPIITAYRDILYYEQVPELGTVLHALLLGLLLLFVGSVLFGKWKRHFVEVL